MSTKYVARHRNTSNRQVGYTSLLATAVVGIVALGSLAGCLGAGVRSASAPVTVPSTIAAPTVHALPLPSPYPPGVQPVPSLLPACNGEDDPSECFWDAQTDGNGTGRSFIHHVDGTISYMDGQP